RIAVDAVDAAAHAAFYLREPAIELAEDDWVTDTGQRHCLVTNKLGRFQAHGVTRRRPEGATRDAHRAVVHRFIAGAARIEDTRRLDQAIGIAVLVEAVGGDAGRRATQARVRRHDREA